MQAFTREVKAYASLLKLPGLAVAVVQDGKIIYKLNEGYADVENRFLSATTAYSRLLRSPKPLLP